MQSVVSSGNTGLLEMSDSLLLYRARIVVPAKLQHDTICKIHRGHQGIERCRLRVTTSVWWPGVSSQIEQFIKQCPTCVKTTPPVREPMLSSELPKHPWQKVATDLFELNRHLTFGSRLLLMLSSSYQTICDPI